MPSEFKLSSINFERINTYFAFIKSIEEYWETGKIFSCATSDTFPIENAMYPPELAQIRKYQISLAIRKHPGSSPSPFLFLSYTYLRLYTIIILEECSDLRGT